MSETPRPLKRQKVPGSVVSPVKTSIVSNPENACAEETQGNSEAKCVCFCFPKAWLPIFFIHRSIPGTHWLVKSGRRWDVEIKMKNRKTEHLTVYCHWILASLPSGEDLIFGVFEDDDNDLYSATTLLCVKRHELIQQRKTLRNLYAVHADGFLYTFYALRVDGSLWSTTPYSLSFDPDTIFSLATTLIYRNRLPFPQSISLPQYPTADIEVTLRPLEPVPTSSVSYDENMLPQDLPIPYKGIETLIRYCSLSFSSDDYTNVISYFRILFKNMTVNLVRSLTIFRLRTIRTFLGSHGGDSVRILGSDPWYPGWCYRTENLSECA